MTKGILDKALGVDWFVSRVLNHPGALWHRWSDLVERKGKDDNEMFVVTEVKGGKATPMLLVWDFSHAGERILSNLATAYPLHHVHTSIPQNTKKDVLANK